MRGPLVCCAILSIFLIIGSAINAQMRRIDLTCKLMGPLFISLVDGLSTEVAILVNLGMNLASVVVEYFAIAKVRLIRYASFVCLNSKSSLVGL